MRQFEGRSNWTQLQILGNKAELFLTGNARRHYLEDRRRGYLGRTDLPRNLLDFALPLAKIIGLVPLPNPAQPRLRGLRRQLVVPSRWGRWPEEGNPTAERMML